MRPRETLVDRLSGYATGAVASFKRRQVRQKPRIRVGWEDGSVQMIDCNSLDGEAMLAEADELIEILTDDKIVG